MILAPEQRPGGASASNPWPNESALNLQVLKIVGKERAKVIKAKSKRVRQNIPQEK